MAWYDEAIFYHIYPLGLTGAPKQNSYGAPEYRFKQWSDVNRMQCDLHRTTV